MGENGCGGKNGMSSEGRVGNGSMLDINSRIDPQRSVGKCCGHMMDVYQGELRVEGDAWNLGFPSPIHLQHISSIGWLCYIQPCSRQWRISPTGLAIPRLGTGPDGAKDKVWTFSFHINLYHMAKKGCTPLMVGVFGDYASQNEARARCWDSSWELILAFWVLMGTYRGLDGVLMGVKRRSIVDTSRWICWVRCQGGRGGLKGFCQG